MIETVGTGVVRKIECPRHFLISPAIDVYKREVVPELKNVSDSLVRSGRARKTRIVRDAFGNPVLDWKKIYDHKRKCDGKVLQPLVTSKFAIEHIYDPKNPICILQCKKRCFRGVGNVNERGIKRLNG